MPSSFEIVDGAEDGERRGADHYHMHKNAEGVGADQAAVSHPRIEGHAAHCAERYERADERRPIPRRAVCAAPRNGSATMMMMPKKHRTISGARRCRFWSCSAGNWITAAPSERQWRRASRHVAAAVATAAPGASSVQRRARRLLPGLTGVLRVAHRLLDQAIGCGLHAMSEQRRSDAHEENRERDGDENQAFAAGGIGQRAIFFDGDFAERDALVGPQQIDRGEHRAAGGPGGPGVMKLEDADQDQEFTDEAVERRQRQRREADEQEEGHQHGHGRRQAAEFLDFVRVAAVVEHAHAEEERAGGDAVVEHLVNGALNRNGGEGKNSEHDEAQVADGGVGDQALEIGLNGGDQRAVNDADDGQNGDERGHAMRGVRKERQAEAQHAVGAELQHHAGEDHGAGGGRFGVRVRQPCVQREERNFDGKGQEERAEEPEFGVRRKQDVAALQTRCEFRQIEGANQHVSSAEIVEPQDGDQHQDGAEHRVQNEFHGGVDAAVVAPDADQEIHGDERQFPEDEEEEQVERDENADHGRFDYQQRDEEALHVFVD